LTSCNDLAKLEKKKGSPEEPNNKLAKPLLCQTYVKILSDIYQNVCVHTSALHTFFGYDAVYIGQ